MGVAVAAAGAALVSVGATVVSMSGGVPTFRAAAVFDGRPSVDGFVTVGCHGTPTTSTTFRD